MRRRERIKDKEKDMGIHGLAEKLFLLLKDKTGELKAN